MGIRRSQNFAAFPRILSHYLFVQRVSFWSFWENQWALEPLFAKWELKPCSYDTYLFDNIIGQFDETYHILGNAD